MGNRYEFAEAAHCPVGVLINTEDPDDDLSDDLGDDVGLVLGDAGGTALVITGNRAELSELIEQAKRLVEALPADWPAYRDTFVKAYIEAAVWADTIREITTDGKPDSEQVTGADEDNLTADARADLRRSALSFLSSEEVLQDLHRAAHPLKGSYNAEQAGHDFWLSRNGHGAGFWDRGLGEVGDRLHANAKPYGSAHIWQDEDGSLHYEEG